MTRLRDILLTLKTPSDVPVHPVRKFREEGGFSGEWFRSLPDAMQRWYQMTYWNHVHACFRTQPFPESRIQFFGDDSDVVWELLDIEDAVSVLQEHVEVFEKYGTVPCEGSLKSESELRADTVWHQSAEEIRAQLFFDPRSYNSYKYNQNTVLALSAL